jgi:hypothetical protein
MQPDFVLKDNRIHFKQSFNIRIMQQNDLHYAKIRKMQSLLV